MAYDKKSFLAGLSAGTQLRGWASYPSDVLSRYSIDATRVLPSPPVIPATAFLCAEVTAVAVLPSPPLIEVFSFLEV